MLSRCLNLIRNLAFKFVGTLENDVEMIIDWQKRFSIFVRRKAASVHCNRYYS